MRPALVSAVLVCLQMTLARADAPAQTKLATRTAAQTVPGEFRCAYIGRCGSFHLIGEEGTAAYRTPTGEYIDELKMMPSEPGWWLYRAVLNVDTSDHVSEAWAISRRRDRNGRFRVMRFVRGAWRFYETAYGWGQGMDGRFIASARLPEFDEANSQSATGSIRSLNLKNVAGVNAELLGKELIATLGRLSVPVNETSLAVKGDAITVFSAPITSGQVHYTFRVIARVRSQSKEVSIQVAVSAASADGLGGPITLRDNAPAQRLYDKVVKALQGIATK